MSRQLKIFICFAFPFFYFQLYCCDKNIIKIRELCGAYNTALIVSSIASYTELGNAPVPLFA